MPPLSIPEIARVAAEVRLQLAPGLSVLEPVPFALVARRVRIWGLAGPLTVVCRGHGGLEADTFAVTIIDLANELGWIWLHRDAWRELAREVPRTRFTMAHELMHCALHAEDLDGLNVRAEPDHHKRLEEEANRAAGHLLIPDQALRRLAQHDGGLDQTAIMKRFGVGARTAEKRIEEYMKTA